MIKPLLIVMLVVNMIVFCELAYLLWLNRQEQRRRYFDTHR